MAVDPDLLALIRRAPPTAHQPLLILAAVHYLLLGGLDHPLGAVYRGTSDADPAPLFRDLCLTHPADILEIMGRHHVQTNEVGRSALIGPALSWGAEPSRRPAPACRRRGECRPQPPVRPLPPRLRPRRRHRTGRRRRPHRVSCRRRRPTHRTGALPPIGLHAWASTATPSTCADAGDARWLLACIWPDTDRLRRMQLAIDVARRDPPVLVRGDALTALPATLADLPDDGVACVLTTWSFAYLLPADRSRFVDLLAESGRRRPVVWLAGDSSGVVDLVDPGPAPDHGGGEPAVLTAVSFDADGIRPQLLAFVQSHGRWLDWRAA